MFIECAHADSQAWTSSVALEHSLKGIFHRTYIACVQIAEAIFHIEYHAM